MEGRLAAPLLELQSFANIHSAAEFNISFSYFIFIFHFLHLAFCSRSDVRQEQFSKGMILKCTSLTELL